MEYSAVHPGRRCQFASCGANRRDNPDRKFFKFPVLRRDICRQWVINCANEKILNLPDEKLKHHLVCERHFTRECFTSDMLIKLEKDAVPTLLDNTDLVKFRMPNITKSLSWASVFDKVSAMAASITIPPIPNGFGTVASNKVVSRTTDISASSPRTTKTSASSSRTTDTSASSSRTTDTSASSSRIINTSASSSRPIEPSASSSRTPDTSASSSRTTNTSALSLRTTNTSASSSRTTDTPALFSRATNTSALSSRTTNTSASSSRTTDTPALFSRAIKPPASSSRTTNTPALSSRAIKPSASSSRTTDTPALSSRAIKPSASSSRTTDTPALSSRAIKPSASSSRTTDISALSSRAIEPSASSSRTTDTLASSLRAIEPSASSSRATDTSASSSRAIEPSASSSRAIEPSASFLRAIEATASSVTSSTLSESSVTSTTAPQLSPVSSMKNIIGQGSFEHFCRICSCQNEKGKLISVFDNDDLLEKITSCLPITIHEGDELPHQVCEKCLNAIENCYDLISKAQSSEKYFFNCLKNEANLSLKSEEESETVFNSKKQPHSLELDGTFDCDLCGARLPEAEDLDTHIQEKHFNQSAPPNTQFTVHKICSLCGQLFDCDEVYVLHKCESHPRCLHCKKTMPTKCLLNRHIQHSCKQLYFCPHCHKTFSGKISFMKHVQGHTGVKSEYECLACDRKAYGNGEVTEHTCNRDFNEHSLSGKKYKCYICGQAYKRQLNLAKHCLQHEPKTKWKFKCTKCDDVFEKEKTLHSHYEKVHKMPKTWVCRFCGKSLSTKLSVQIHERIHTQVKPYVCEWCGNAFRSKANLIQHHAKHTGIRRHKCPVCGKMFSRTFFLKTHLRVHTGERPYQCDICDQRFTQVGDMRRHRKRHDQSNSVSVSQPTVIIVRRDGQVAQTASLPVVTFNTMPVDTVQLKLEGAGE